MITRTAAAATDRQIAFVLTLVAERQGGQAYVQTQLDSLKVTHPRDMSKSEVSNLIDVLQGMPRARAAAGAGTDGEVEPGMYRVADGTMYKAYKGQSGRVLAKRLVEDGGEDGWGFEYAGLASRFVTAADRMSVEDAVAFGAQYGQCVRCLKHLTDPTSVAASMGPTCRRKM